MKKYLSLFRFYLRKVRYTKDGRIRTFEDFLIGLWKSKITGWVLIFVCLFLISALKTL